MGEYEPAHVLVEVEALLRRAGLPAGQLRVLSCDVIAPRSEYPLPHRGPAASISPTEQNARERPPNPYLDLQGPLPAGSSEPMCRELYRGTESDLGRRQPLKVRYRQVESPNLGDRGSELSWAVTRPLIAGPRRLRLGPTRGLRDPTPPPV
jgi:hypothetical protein